MRILKETWEGKVRKTGLYSEAETGRPDDAIGGVRAKNGVAKRTIETEGGEGGGKASEAAAARRVTAGG